MDDDYQPIAGTEASNAFCAVFGELRKGAAAQEASRKLAEAVDASRLTGKPSTVTLKLTIKPTGEAMCLRETVTLKLPEPEKVAAIFFPTNGVILSRKDPRQQEMQLRVADDKPEVEEPRQGRTSEIRKHATGA